MRYEIKGDTLPVVVCYLENGEKMITRTWLDELDVSEHEDGNHIKWRNRKSIWKNVFRRGIVPEPLYSNGR